MKRIIISCLMAFCLLPVWAQRRIGVLLPFQSGSALSQSMVEFYRGMLMAADSVRHLGLNVEIHAMDPGVTERSMQDALQHSGMDGMDVIVGPGVAGQADVLADFCRRHRIQLLMPFNMPYADLPRNAYVFQCVAPQDAVYKDVVRMVMDKFIDAHFVLLQTNGHGGQGTGMQTALRQKLDEMGIPYNVLDVSSEGTSIARAMDVTRRNVVVPDSPSYQTMQQSVGQMARFLNDNGSYMLSLLGYPEWLEHADAYAMHFHALDTYLFTTYYNNPLSGRSIRFQQQYAENFHQQHPAMRPSLSMLGFDLGFYAMGLTASATLQNTFHFTPVTANGGCINHHVQLVHYSPNRMIQLEK